MSATNATPTDRKVRYGFVALGDITQEAMLPGVDHTGNSVVTALVSSDTAKAAKVAERYGIDSVYSYDQFDELLASGKIDALYIATPNWRHAEFVIPALKAGIHVLVEKPLEISSEASREILATAAASTAKLMVAYRLHFEPSTLSLIDRIRSGELGQVHTFSATFAQMVDPTNHRATNGAKAGPVFDMAPYPINAARYVFDADPIEVVSAVGLRHPDSGLGDFDHTVAVTLRFPGHRVALFSVSYYGHAVDAFYAAGTKGSVHMRPCFTYGESLEQTVSVGDMKHTLAPPATDQFGGELKYFSECVLGNEDPEPDGQEGLIDVLIVEGIMEALASGKPQKLDLPARERRIDTQRQKMTLPKVEAPAPVDAAKPSK
ncbi:Gfo/Idh/MocA family protein [Xanthomonas sp. NCPPB 2632]|uniref:Gfo/Idh/MocA family protein n=1 Tax=Xanthomonas sp. NCPPB 2632 TaxID=3240912 RepID=UPI0035195054